MLKYLVIALATAGLVGCEERVVTHSERVTMEVVHVELKSKSNSRVDLQVVGTHKIHHDLRLRCRRSEAKNVKIGSKWDVVVEDYRYGDRHGTEVTGVDAICDKSQ